MPRRSSSARSRQSCFCLWVASVVLYGGRERFFGWRSGLDDGITLVLFTVAGVILLEAWEPRHRPSRAAGRAVARKCAYRIGVSRSSSFG